MQYFSICSPLNSTLLYLTGKRKIIIKPYYFVAVLSLTYTPILPTFFKNKKTLTK